MSLRGKGRVIIHERGGCYIYIPKDVAKDSTFPFSENEDIEVEIKNGNVLITTT